jgi:hypothetical protein
MRLLPEARARAACLHLLLGEAVVVPPQLMQVQAIGVVAGHIAQEKVAVFGGAE